MFTEPEHSSPLEPGRHRSSNYAVFVLFVCIWYICNAIAGIKTKVALVDTHDNWAFIELSFCQSVIGTMMAVALVQVRKFLSRLWGKQTYEHNSSNETTKNRTDQEESMLRWQITVIAVSHALGNVLTNIGIHLIGTSRTQVLKVAEPVCTVILTRFLTPKAASTDYTTLVAIGLICSGLVVTAWSHQQFTLAGVVVMFASNLALPLRNISIKHVSTTREHIDHSVLFLRIVKKSLLWFSFAIVVKQLITGRLSMVTRDFIWSSILTNGYHMSSLLCLEFIDPITHSIANVFKRAFTIVSALVYFQEAVEFPTLIGLEVAFVGLFLYAQAKMKHIDIVRLFKSAAIMALVLYVGWMFVGIQSDENVEPVGLTSLGPASPNSGEILVRTWRWSDDNFGDALGPVVLRRLLTKSCNCTVNTVIRLRSPRLLTIGSIFDTVQAGDVLWGSGIKEPKRLLHKGKNKVSPKSFKILYMRGPRSFQAFRSIYDPDSYNTFPEIYGDPGLLFGCLFPRFLPNQTNVTRRQPLFISHLSVKDQIGSHKFLDGVAHINAFRPWRKVIRAISSSSLVISSSLHGIIIAESLGIPARFVGQGIRREPFFKFHDYYEGTGRKFDDVASTIKDALKIGGVREKPVFDPQLIIKLLIDAIPDLVKDGIIKMSPGCSCAVPTNLCTEKIS
eukprot:TRINITY_DN992_c0_g1_i2.p1 TRINITY_DN992_c0_g1~~TRINITY_DN992_c0_g1_i2.p1  ORF type:complete len:675 (-),score=57.41 TRINITY_DN992_c0_g1_i2:440-2464(-)